MCYNIERMQRSTGSVTYRNSSQVVKLKMRLLQQLCVLQSWYNVTSTRHKSHVAQQKLFTYLVFQLVTQHHLMLATYPSQFVTRYNLSEYDVNSMLSIIF